MVCGAHGCNRKKKKKNNCGYIYQKTKAIPLNYFIVLSLVERHSKTIWGFTKMMKNLENFSIEIKCLLEDENVCICHQCDQTEQSKNLPFPQALPR